MSLGLFVVERILFIFTLDKYGLFTFSQCTLFMSLSSVWLMRSDFRCSSGSKTLCIALMQLLTKPTDNKPPLEPENAWNTRNPELVVQAYTPDSRWRNRTEFFTDREAIVEFLRRKWTKELDYRLMKEALVLYREPNFSTLRI